MGRDIRIEEVDGGYIIRGYEPMKTKSDADVMYPGVGQTELVVSSKDEAKGVLDKWLSGESLTSKK